MDRRRAELRALSRALPSGEALVEGPRQRLDRAEAALATRIRGSLDARALRLAGLARGLARHSPRAHLAGLQERVHGLTGRLTRLGPALIERPRREAEAAARGLLRGRAHLARRRTERGADLLRLGARLDRAFAEGALARRSRLAALWQLASAVSYRGVLARGFALVRDEADRAVRRAAETREGQTLTIEFADRAIQATAGRETGGAASRAPVVLQPRPRRARGGGDDGGQGTLF